MKDKDFIEKLKSKKWYFTYDRKMSYQRIGLFSHGYRKELSEFFNVKINSEIYRIRNEDVSVYYELNDHLKAFETIGSMLSNDSSATLIKRIKSTIEVYYKEFINDIKKKPEDYSKFGNKNLILSLKNFSKQNEKISLPTWLLYLYVEDILTNEVKKRLETKINDKKKVVNVLSIISKPTKLLPIDTYNIDLYKTALLKGSKLEKAFERFSKKYKSWGVYDVNFQVQNVVFHKEQVKNLSEKEAREKIRIINKKYLRQVKDLKSVKHIWGKDKNLKVLVELYLLYVNFKDWKNYYREQSAYKMKILFNEIANRLSLTLKQVAFLTAEETTLALEHTMKLDSEEIDRRASNSAIVYLDDNLSIITDEVTLEEIDGVTQIKGVTLISGSIAYAGVVKGTVKIISGIQDFDKVNEGDVLVASTTRPDYLPFMKKSSAFITNEGGMLSHAAIMARELKKPCIIGTKNATKILKDGDIVEVDANKGIITIVKK